MEERAG